jgi:hypothetical protein
VVTVGFVSESEVLFLGVFMLSVSIVDDMTEFAVKKYLKLIIQSLNSLDDEEFFGPEGWRKFMGFEGE